jgi:uncharacterized SAM-binding protein YcdF (DUF218 family)
MQRFLAWGIAALLMVFVMYIPVQLMAASIEAPKPQVIFTLGGRESREAFTAEFAKQHPDLNIWISSGMEAEKARPLFQAAGIDLERVHFDRRASDTVTNFTTMADEFRQQKIHHVYLITSDFHMPRAKAIATIVFGSRGITVTPVTVPSFTTPESSVRIVRDVVRSLFWIVTGHTGASLRYYTPLSD